MQRLEVSGAVRLIYRSLGVKGLIICTVLLFSTVNESFVFQVAIQEFKD